MEKRGRERESSQAEWIFGPLHPSPTPLPKRQKIIKKSLSHSLARRFTRDTFNQSALIAAPLWLRDARASFPFIEFLVIIISQTELPAAHSNRSDTLL